MFQMGILWVARRILFFFAWFAETVGKEMTMNIDSLASAASLENTRSLLTFKTGLDIQKAQMEQILQTMPKAPKPAHLGQNFDIYA
jgi:hypothetical protein